MTIYIKWVLERYTNFFDTPTPDTHFIETWVELYNREKAGEIITLDDLSPMPCSHPLTNIWNFPGNSPVRSTYRVSSPINFAEPASSSTGRLEEIPLSNDYEDPSQDDCPITFSEVVKVHSLLEGELDEEPEPD